MNMSWTESLNKKIKCKGTPRPVTIMKYWLTLMIHIIIIAIDLFCGVYGNMVAHRSTFHSCLCEFPPGSSSILPLPKNILEDGLVKITLGCACVCVCVTHPVTSRVCSCLLPSFPGIGSDSTVTLTRIRQLLKIRMNECWVHDPFIREVCE